MNYIPLNPLCFRATAETKYGMMRFLFTVNVGDNEVTESGVKFINPKNLQGGLTVDTGNKKASYHADMVEIPEGTEGTFYAKAYVTTSAGTYWSEAVPCTMNWNKYFTGYTYNSNNTEGNE